MESTAKGFKRKIDKHRWMPYYHSEERIDYSHPHGHYQSIYDNAMRSEDIITFQFDELSPEDKLRHLATAIEISTRITAYHIFKNGEFLHMAKKICQEKNIRFRLWVVKTCGFSYETALNFIAVYQTCLGHRQFAERIQPSVLYKISAPSFPNELRESLFESGVLENCTNKDVNDLLNKYKVSGFEAIEEDIDLLGSKFRTEHKIRYSFDLCENALRVLNDLSKKMSVRGESFLRIDLSAEEDSVQQQSIPSNINNKLYKALIDSLRTIEEAVSQSKEELKEFQEQVKIVV